LVVVLALAFAGATLAPFRAPLAVLGALAVVEARFLPLGAPFLAVALLVEVASFGATGAAVSATAAAWVVLAASMVFMAVVPFLRVTAHHIHHSGGVNSQARG
jgi:hypothetical protein